ncbi:MAG TPA: hypothetical protein VGH28_34215 [Polyangiaceae bacterium]
MIALACGGSVDATPDSGTASDAGRLDSGVQEAAAIDAGFPGPHPSVPQVESYGGPVLDAPNVIPIFFANDDKESKVEDFLNQLAASPFWAESTKEYGAGPLSVGKSIVVSDTPPQTIDVAQIESWLASHLDGTHPEWPALAQNNVYTVFYPTETVISDPELGTSCKTFGGFHYEAKTADGKSIVYAVMPRCDSLGQSVKGDDALTGGLSHELIESATDPLMVSNAAYTFVDVPHMIWNLMPLGEIGDMCAYEPQSFQRLVGPYMVQRVWSNQSALAGHDPCAPAIADPYFNAAPILNDSVTLDYYGQKIVTKGVQVPLGQSKTIDVEMFSDAPTSDWTVQAVDETYGTGKPAQLTFSWDSQTGNNGDVRHVTITRDANGTHGGTEFILYAQHGTTSSNMWFAFVAN